VQRTKEFYKLSFRSGALAIGQRMKGGTFRPCVETLPSSTLSGALAEFFPGVRAAALGFLRAGSYQKAYFTYSPRDPRTGSSVLPLTLEYLAPAPGCDYVEGDVYLPHTSVADEVVKALPLDLSMGALRYRGFGQVHLELISLITAADSFPTDRVSFPYRRGYFEGRVRENEIEEFDIKIIAPRYGYLLEPDDRNPRTGRYRRSIFPGSLIEAPAFLVAKEYKYDV